LPLDVYQDSQEIRKLAKNEIQNLLQAVILRDYKIEMKETTMELFDKEAIAQLYVEIKNGEYSDRNIKNPIPYFTEVLIKKHGQMTGEEISKSSIRRHEMDRIKEDWDISEVIETSAVEEKIKFDTLIKK